MTGRTPRDLRDAMSAFVDRVDLRGGRATARAASVWREAVGPEIAARTHASAVRDGELVVHVSSAAWATELQALSAHLTEAVNTAAGEELVSGVRFTVSRAVQSERDAERVEAERDSVYRPASVTPEPLSEVERVQIEAVTAEIEDERLREAFVRAMVADLEWKRGVARRPPKGPATGPGAASETPSGAPASDDERRR